MALRQAPPALNPAEALVAAQTDAKSWKTYPCTLVTPMYGGGVKAGVVDEAMPIRASAIRGQLRFWWRLLAIHRDGMSPQAAREREFAVWGGLGTPPTASRVWVQVVIPTDAKKNFRVEEWAEFVSNDRGGFKSVPEPKKWVEGAEYALFPGQGDHVLGAAKLLQPGGQWSLRLAVRWLAGDAGKLADLAQEEKRVHDALRWWACFGGVGARTRRGLGAVKVEGLEPVTPGEVQKVSGCQLVQTGRGEPDDVDGWTRAWTAAVGRLQKFRQGVDGRKYEGRKPKRSYWPEPDAIRIHTRQHSSRHVPMHKAGNFFPRAAFGLPIVFHFKDGKNGGDPFDCILSPKGQERMASPLILRPYLQNGKWFPSVLLLPAALPKVLRLAASKPSRDKFAVEFSDWWQPEKAALVPPMVSRGTDALSAFLKYFQGK